MLGLLEGEELTQEAFEDDSSYPITYYDNPLQPGIMPRWSDQNVLGGGKVCTLGVFAHVRLLLHI